MAQEFNSPFSPFGATQPEEELLYPEQGMQFGGTGNSLFGTQPTDGGVDPTVLAGLGLGGGIVAAGTGGQAATSQVLSPMAQKIAAQDAARQSAAAAQARVNNRIIGSNMPAGGANPTVTGSVKPGTLQNPSNIIGRNLPSGGANPQVTGRVRPGTLGSMARPAAGLAALGGAGASSTAVAPATAALIGGYLAGKTADVLGGDALRGAGLTDREGGMFGIGGELIGEAIYGDSNLSAFSPEELANIQQGTVASGQMATPESVAGLSFTGTPLTQEAITNPQLQFSGSQANQATPPVQAVETASDEGKGNLLSRGIDFFFGPSTPEQAQRILETQPTDPAQRARLQATAEGRGEPSDIQKAISYLFAPNEVAGDPNILGYDERVEAARAAKVAETQPTSPEIPQGAPGSPQAFFEEYRSKGPLTPEQISRGEAAAARMGTTFNPDTGFSQAEVQPGAVAPVTSGLVTQSGIPLSEFLSGAAIPSAGLRAESPMYADNSVSRGLTGDAGRAAYEAASAEREGRLAARMQQPGETITERDTRVAGERTTGPRTYGGYTTAQIRGAVGGGKALRAAQMQAEMEGKQAEAEYLQEQQMAAQEAAYKQQQAILESELKQAVKDAKPGAVQEAIDEANDLILAGTITPDQMNAAVLQRLKYDPEGLIDFDDIVKKDTGLGGDSGENRTFATEEEAIASGVKGEVTIGGRPARI